MRVAILILLVGCTFDPDEVPTTATPGPEIPDAGDSPWACPNGYEKTDGSGSCYRTFAVAADWLAAELSCEADAPGSHLLVLTDSAETAAWQAFSSARNTDLWVGLSNRQEQPQWRWCTGATTDIAGEIALDQGRCAFMSPVGLIVGEPCEVAYPYICELDGEAVISF